MEGGRKLRFHWVQREVRLPLAAEFLIDQGHDAGKGGRRNGGSAKAADLNGSVAGYGHAIAVGHAGGIVAEVRANAGEQRNVGDIAHPVCGNTGAGLPGGLGVAGGAGGPAAIRVRTASRYATAGSAAAGPNRGTSVRWRVDVKAILAAVPRLLGDDLQQRSLRKHSRGCVPVSGQLAAEGIQVRIVAVVEIRAADRDVVRRRGKAVDAGALHCIFLSIEVIASSRAIVTGGNHDGNTLGGSLLPKVAQESVRGFKTPFAFSDTYAHYRSDVAIDGVFGGKKQPRFGIRIGGDDQIDGCVGRHCSGPLNVEIGFPGRIRGYDPRVVAVNDNAQVIRRQAEEGPKKVDLLNIDIG